ncbi:MAG: hypothetical protein ACD_28C00111G0008 [uncultured bacterium]|nr:MAG: hypothetical protein ACD_28C00111G0008 [uncultured bacterium]
MHFFGNKIRQCYKKILTICNTKIREGTKDLTYESTSEIPKNQVGLILGTAQYLKDGRKKLYHRRYFKDAPF